jgi:hypothetical protein
MQEQCAHNKPPESRGAKGGMARAARLSTERKTEIAKKAAFSRWQSPRSNKSNNINVLVPSGPQKPREPEQGVF